MWLRYEERRAERAEKGQEQSRSRERSSAGRLNVQTRLSGRSDLSLSPPSPSHFSLLTTITLPTTPGLHHNHESRKSSTRPHQAGKRRRLIVRHVERYRQHWFMRLYWLRIARSLMIPRAVDWIGRRRKAFCRGRSTGPGARD